MASASFTCTMLPGSGLLEAIASRTAAAVVSLGSHCHSLVMKACMRLCSCAGPVCLKRLFCFVQVLAIAEACAKCCFAIGKCHCFAGVAHMS